MTIKVCTCVSAVFNCAQSGGELWVRGRKEHSHVLVWHVFRRISRAQCRALLILIKPVYWWKKTNMWKSGPALLFLTWPHVNTQMRENKILLAGLLQMHVKQLSVHSTWHIGLVILVWEMRQMHADAFWNHAQNNVGTCRIITKKFLGDMSSSVFVSIITSNHSYCYYANG